MSLRVRLEGAYEALEDVTLGARELGARLDGEWRRLDRSEPLRRLLTAVADELEVLPRAHAKIAALRDRVTRKEQRELEKLVAAAGKALQKLEEKVDRALQVSGAERLGSLERRLRGLVALSAPWAPGPGEPEVATFEGRLVRRLQNQLFRRYALMRGERFRPGVVTLTTRALQYEDAARRLELPLRDLEMTKLPEQVTLKVGDELFEAEIPELSTLLWCIALLRAFVIGEERRPFFSADVPARRLGDGLSGRLLVWSDGVLFLPEDRVGALAGVLLREETVPFDLEAARKAIGALLPWIADQVLTRMAASTWNWSWRSEDVELELGLTDGYLRHRSGSLDEPVYAVPPGHAEECLAVLGQAKR